MMRVLILILFCFAQMFAVVAQESELDSILTEVMYFEEDELLYFESERDKTFHFLYANSTYNNRNYYAGRAVADPQYYLSGQLSYFNSKGFFMGFGISSGTWFSANENASYNNAIMVGYGKAFKKLKALRFNVSYSRYFGIDDGINFSSTYSNSINAGLGVKLKWIGSRASLNVLFGDDSKSTFSWDVYTNIKLADFGNYNNIKFEPELSFFFDSEEVEVQQQNMNAPLSYEKQFGLLNTELNLPLVINYKDFDFELGYTLNMPRSLDHNYSYDNTSFITVSVGYVFEL